MKPDAAGHAKWKTNLYRHFQFDISRGACDSTGMFSRWLVAVMAAAFLWICLPCAAGWTGGPGDALFPDEVTLPSAGAMDARALTPTMIQVRAVASRQGWELPPSHWGAVERDGTAVTVPEAKEFEIRVDGVAVTPLRTGFRREPILADYHQFDLRLLNSLFLELPDALRDGAEVEIVNLPGALWPLEKPLRFRFEATRFTPLIHTNHAGYVPGFAKSAFVSGNFGSLGEMEIAPGTEARVIDSSGATVFEGPLAKQREDDWDWHQQVWRFDFSKLETPGVFRVEVPGLGRSSEIRIHDGAFAAAARLHALGMLNQRSGFEKRLPFTRIEHAASHTRPAAVPTTGPDFRNMNRNLARMVGNNMPKDGEPAQSAPPLLDVDASLFPFVRTGEVDVSGGHFDAGDYSKYTTNSSQLVAALVFAADNFPGVDRIDNLGIPESGDKVPDALQIAKWEADFLVKMQDEDGGFYFLVYPRERSYELDVLPENGDPQVVFPKNLIATGAATGALAQCAASPLFRNHFPEEAARYLKAAKRGHAFLQKAIERHGLDGAHQVISHYGRDKGALDEVVYAAAALFAATGEKKYEKELMDLWPDPLGTDSWKWGWVPHIGSYGPAARVYAFVEQNGTLPPGTANPEYLAKMRGAIAAGADSLIKLADANAFGIPLSLAGKRSARVGWYWAMEFAFDLAAAILVTDDEARRQRLLGAVLDCAAFEWGANPVNRTYVSGAGPLWRRQLVNRITLNDDRTLAVSGIASGNVVSTPDNVRPYKIEGANGLRRMYFPTLDAFPFYDRAALDAYNVRAEFVTATTAKILATYLFLLAQSEEAGRPWTATGVSIDGVPVALDAGEPFEAGLLFPPGLSLEDATVVWEITGQEPQTGLPLRTSFQEEGPQRLEVEAVWPDGRRVFAVQKVDVGPKSE